MIIQNGQVEFITEQSGGFDATTLHPASAINKTYGVLIPCQYSAVTYNALAQSNDEAVTQRSYSILIEQFWESHVTSRLRLSDRNGNNLGEFSIIRVEPLDAVCEIKIIV